MESKTHGVILEVKNLAKAFGNVKAVTSVSMEVQEGEILGILGPNGSGKTTLFNLLTGVHLPDAGQVRFNGRDITRATPFQRSRAGIGRTYQIPRPFGNMTVLENLMVAATCERFQMPCISLDAPLEAWLPGGPYTWTHHSFWSVEKDFFPVCKGMWSQVKTNKIVGLLANNDPDGIAFGDAFKHLLPPLGYKIIDPGSFPYGTQDFTSLINTWKKEKVEILFGNVITPDFINCWRQCHQMGFKPKIATVARAILFPASVEALGGDIANGLSTEVWWSPHHPFSSSLTGESAKDLCDAYTRETGKQWSPPIGFKHAAYEVLFDALTRAKTLEKKQLLKAIAATDLNTIVGPIKYNGQNYSRTPLVGGQWAKGEKFPFELKIVHNQEHPDIPTSGTLTPIGA